MSITTRIEQPTISLTETASFALPKRDLADLQSNSGPLDYRALLDICLGSVDFLVILLEEFQVNGPRRVESLARRVERGDSQAASETAHDLKASAQAISANTLRDLAGAIEKSCGFVGRECQEKLVGRLRHEMDRCLEQIPLVIATARAEEMEL